MAEFKEELLKLSKRIENTKDRVLTEEATKMSFIVPFLRILGYDATDPSVVIPEFTADIGTRNGEKVDYAILKDDSPLILIEAKHHSENLDTHCNQLMRYFNVTKAKFAILTNGIEYRFYTDSQEPNIMDLTPFLLINMNQLIDSKLKELEKFKCDKLNIDDLSSMATEQIYHNKIRDIFKQEIENPSDDFTRFFAQKITSNRITGNVLDKFRSHIKRVFTNMINDIANEKIDSIQAQIKQNQSHNNSQQSQIEENNINTAEDNQIITTEEELQSFYIVRSILVCSPTIQASDVNYKDTKSYFYVYLYNRTTKWVCRIYYRPNGSYIVIPDQNGEDKRYDIQTPDDIYSLREELIKYANSITK
ncbi:MAG: type I restriction enzyme HsdR N-terminal domain-containing protein [Campylobacter sp.]|nr:type I restriction enzyme HsdR N-terminal domain-containing protein [Campylobacter sp.]